LLYGNLSSLAISIEVPELNELFLWKNNEKYHVEKSKGTAKKYNDLLKKKKE
jgi:hypothetical protein